MAAALEEDQRGQEEGPSNQALYAEKRAYYQSRIALFEKYNVLSPRETESRYEVYAEQYVMSINVESNLMLEIGKTMIFPAAIRYQGELATSLAMRASWVRACCRAPCRARCLPARR